jgi:DNA polymerase-3 subunit delta'
MKFTWHESVWKTLRGIAERLPHALLIHGVAGIGKLALAERFAQFLLCEARSAAGDACGGCEACRWYAAGNHPDLRRVEPEAIARQPVADAGDEPASNARVSKPSAEIKVGQVRELADFLNIGSHRGRLRVALLHPAEDMNTHAANALLKSLEEPPSGAIFVLVSHRPAGLPPTVRSRCVSLAVPVPGTDEALAWLKGQGVQDAARWLAFAGGAPLRAIRYGETGHAEAAARMLRALASGDRAAVAAAISTREELELLAEVLQKLAIDQALSGFGAAAMYGTAGTAASAASARQWLQYARLMGRNRVLARHPLNPRLFAGEMVSRMPDTAN